VIRLRPPRHGVPPESGKPWRARLLGDLGRLSNPHQKVPRVAQHLVRLKTCAEQRDISVMSLRRYIAQGKLTAYRLGPKIIMIDLNEFDAVILKRIPTTTGGE
jgi:hypothetical protein